MKKFISLLTLLFISCATLTATADEFDQMGVGKVSGGQVYEIPDWFKVSFLDLKEDTNDAGSEGKGLMLYMHLENCPYCSRVLEENFRQGSQRKYIEKNFDVIAINILGSREVTWANGKTYSEKQVAGLLDVRFTPTIVFLDQDANKIYQVNGYRKPAALRNIMEYVRSGSYKDTTLAQYTKQNEKKNVYRLRDDSHFSNTTYLKGYDKPLAVILEDKRCHGCDEFHDKVLNHPDVSKELDKFLVIRLDTDSDHKLIGLDGKPTTAKQFAAASGLDYRPGVILYDKGTERFRIDGRLYHFHFKEALRYVSSGAYEEFPTYNAYLNDRQQELMRQGVNINLAE